MSDIVERLKRDTLGMEAADEITRLRAEIDRLMSENRRLTAVVEAARDVCSLSRAEVPFQRRIVGLCEALRVLDASESCNKLQETENVCETCGGSGGGDPSGGGRADARRSLRGRQRSPRRRAARRSPPPP